MFLDEHIWLSPFLLFDNIDVWYLFNGYIMNNPVSPGLYPN